MKSNFLFYKVLIILVHKPRGELAIKIVSKYVVDSNRFLKAIRGFSSYCSRLPEKKSTYNFLALYKRLTVNPSGYLQNLEFRVCSRFEFQVECI